MFSQPTENPTFTFISNFPVNLNLIQWWNNCDVSGVLKLKWINSWSFSWQRNDATFHSTTTTTTTHITADDKHIEDFIFKINNSGAAWPPSHCPEMRFKRLSGYFSCWSVGFKRNVNFIDRKRPPAADVRSSEGSEVRSWLIMSPCTPAVCWGGPGRATRRPPPRRSLRRWSSWCRPGCRDCRCSREDFDCRREEETSSWNCSSENI